MGALDVSVETPINMRSSGLHDAQTLQDRLLRFRDEWVRNRVRDIQQAASNSFKSCSGDTATITALNQFYRSRAFDEFKTVVELELGKVEGQSDFGNSSKVVAVAEKRYMCRHIGHLEMRDQRAPRKSVQNVLVLLL